MNIKIHAAVYSRAAHSAVGQVRKYTGEPYWHHTAAVANMVEDFGGTDTMVAAAYLHDTVEDTGVTIHDIMQEFGLEIAWFVHSLTDQYVDPTIGNRNFRKTLERVRLAQTSNHVQTIKYCDLIDNTQSIVEHDPGFAKVYLKEKIALLEVMDKGDPELRALAMKIALRGVDSSNRFWEKGNEQES